MSVKKMTDRKTGVWDEPLGAQKEIGPKVMDRDES
jgi:hypothetical protein